MTGYGSVDSGKAKQKMNTFATVACIIMLILTAGIATAILLCVCACMKNDRKEQRT